MTISLFCSVIIPYILNKSKAYQIQGIFECQINYRPLFEYQISCRLSQTLMHVRQLIWIVIEDATHISLPVKQLLDRSSLKYYYLAVERRPGMPGVQLILK